MRLAFGVCFLLGCASAPRGSAPPEWRTTQSVLPAGPCGFDPYLSQPCFGDDAGPVSPAENGLRNSKNAPVAKLAVFYGPYATIAEAQSAATGARGKHLDGYPITLSTDDLPLLQPQAFKILVVVALVKNLPDAEAYRTSCAPDANVGELAHHLAPTSTGGPKTTTWDAFRHSLESVIEIEADGARTWAEDDIKKVEGELDEQLAVNWVPLAQQRKLRLFALARLTPLCTLPGRRLFIAHHDRLIEPNYVPVQCADGRDAWALKFDTRYETVVTRHASGSINHQVVLVECDAGIIEETSFPKISGTPSKLFVPGCGES